jgi:hypothetical protein
MFQSETRLHCVFQCDIQQLFKKPKQASAVGDVGLYRIIGMEADEVLFPSLPSVI